jgi:magnesium and cobalt exporter, CNNM family
VSTPLLLVIIGLLFLSGYFSGSEAALFSINRLQIHKLKTRRDRASRNILFLLQDTGRTLTNLLVGNNLVNIALSSIATVFITDLLFSRVSPQQLAAMTPAELADFGEAIRRNAIEISALTVTVAVLIFGETTPKTIAVNFALGTSRLVAGGIVFFSQALRPLIWAMHSLSMLVLKALGMQEAGPTSKKLISRSELRALLEDVDDEPTVMTRHEKKLVQNILNFSRRTAEQIMTPRVDIDDIDIGDDPSIWVDEIRTARHSRIPVYEDDPDNIIGFLPAKDFLLNPERELRELREIIRPAVFFPESATVNDIFAEIQRVRTALVIVVNEYGETAGLITREDVIEEIVGDIYDEFDMEDVPIRRKSDHRYLVHGRTDLADLGEELDIDFSNESSITLNGFLCEVYGHIPRPGTVVVWNDLRFHVLEVARHQVRKVLLELTDPSGSGGNGFKEDGK